MKHSWEATENRYPLGYSRFSMKIALSEAAKKPPLKSTYGIQSLHEVLKRHNLRSENHGALTEAEARLLIRAKTLDAARNRIAAEVQAGSAQGQHGVLQDPEVGFRRSQPKTNRPAGDKRTRWVYSSEP